VVPGVDAPASSPEGDQTEAPDQRP